MENAVTYFYLAAFFAGVSVAWAVLIVEGLRTFARQDASYATGRLPLGSMQPVRLSARTRAR